MSFIIFINPLDPSVVTIRTNTVLNQPATNTKITFGKDLDFSQVKLYDSGVTKFGNSNFTSKGSGAQINITLYQYNSTITNFTANTVNGNNVNFTLTEMSNGSCYSVYKDNSVLKIDSGNDGMVSFNNSVWGPSNFRIEAANATENGGTDNPACIEGEIIEHNYASTDKRYMTYDGELFYCKMAGESSTPYAFVQEIRAGSCVGKCKCHSNGRWKCGTEVVINIRAGKGGRIKIR